MSSSEQKADGLSELRRESLEIERAMREAVHEAVLQHYRLGLPMVEWRDGKIVWVPPEQLLRDDSDPRQ